MTENLTVKIEALAYGGACIGRVVAGPQSLLEKKVFVRDCIPGEVVEAEISEDKRSYLKARLIRVLETSAERVSPPCPYFGKCGGCDLQHINLSFQRSLKAEMIKTMLARQAGLEIEIEMAEAKLPGYHYRNRISLHLNESGDLGYYRAGTGEVVDIEQCLLAEDTINDTLKEIRNYKGTLAPLIAGLSISLLDEGIATLLNLREETVLDEEFSTEINLKSFLDLFPNTTITQKGKIVLRGPESHTGDFAQVNNAGNSVLINQVIKHCKSSRITELYAGGGNFTIPLAKTEKNIDAVEISKSLVRHGKQRAVGEEVSDRIVFHTCSAEKYLKQNRIKDNLLLDPPRSGAKNILRYCNPDVTKRIIYVSCNLPTLQRDLKELSKRGYALTKLLLVDMFPQTHHLETISVLAPSSHRR